MDPESRPTFSQAVNTLESIDLSTTDNIIASTELLNQTTIPAEVPFKKISRNSVSDSSRRTSKSWRRHSSCSDPGDTVQETKGDSGIDPGVFFSEQSKKRLSSSCGRLIAKMEEFTTFEELEAYLRSRMNSSTVGKEVTSVEDTVPCSPSEHAKSNQTTSPQFVTPSVCKTNKPYLPGPSTPHAPPPTPCTSKICSEVSLPSSKDTVYDKMLPRAALNELSSPDVISLCVRRRRTDVKSNELLSSPSSTTEPEESALSPSPELLPVHSLDGFCFDSGEHTHDKKFPYNLYPKQQVVSPPPIIKIASSVDSV